MKLAQDFPGHIDSSAFWQKQRLPHQKLSLYGLSLVLEGGDQLSTTSNSTPAKVLHLQRPGRNCNSLKINGPCRFVYLNTWSPDGGDVWEGYGIFRRWSWGFITWFYFLSYFASCSCHHAYTSPLWWNSIYPLWNSKHETQNQDKTKQNPLSLLICFF